MKKRIPKLLLVIMILALAAPMMTACGGDAADTVIKGTVYTADKDDSVVEAVAVKDGEVTYVGDAAGVEDMIGNKTEVIETGDGMAMPAFSEAHAHGHEGGAAILYEVDLYAGENVKDYQAAVKDFIKEHPEREFIIGTGWINGFLPDGDYAKYLDEVSGDLPVVLISGDHHSYWVNTKAMEMMKIDKNTETPAGGVITKDADGNPNGIFRESAKGLVDEIIPDYTVEELKDAIKLYQEEMASFGVTSYWEPMVNQRANLLQAYQEMEDDGELIMQVYAGWKIEQESNGGDYIGALDEAEKLIEENKGGMFEMNGIKLFTDGVVEGHTTYLMEDYADEPGVRGEGLWDQEDLNKFVAEADKRGIVTHTHAIGDAAVKMIVDAVDYAKQQNPDSEVRHAITHLQIVDPTDIKRMADLDIVAVTNPYWFCKEPGYYEELEVPYLGAERASKEYPMKAFFDEGVIVTVASDYPVTMPSMPLEAIQTAVTRCDRTGNPDTLLGADQRVTVMQMLKAATYNAAYQNNAEETTGSLEVGKEANIVVLDKNIMDIDQFKISKTNVLKTFYNGNAIYEAE